MNINNLIRENIKDLKAYTSARSQNLEGVFLDANENGFGSSIYSNLELNRYPDPNQTSSRKLLAEQISIGYDNIMFGVGSDEILDLLVRIFCEPGKDEVIINEPTYGMYEVISKINNVGIKRINLKDNFQLDIKNIKGSISEKTKLIFICSPNNPTGNLINKNDIIYLAENTNCILVVDEAYIEFSESNSLITEIEKYKNIVITRTFSKAWGLAGMRCGYCIADKEIINYLLKVKAPYNINALLVNKIEEALKNKNLMCSYVDQILSEKKRVVDFLEELPFVDEIFPSDTNFLLIKSKLKDELKNYLLSKKIIIRDRGNDVNLKNCIRITIGSVSENNLLLKEITNFDSEKNISINYNEKKLISETKVKRVYNVSRKTKETNISITCNLDGTGICNINTGIGFFDHMLEQIGRHGNLDLSINVDGDLIVDEHHTVEDTGITLGDCLLKALGNKKGINRYGFMLPMDDSIAECAIDIGGRTYLNYNVKFKREFIGEFPTELIEEFFRGLASGLKANLYLKAQGTNEHHIAESLFKAFAKSLNFGLSFDTRNDGNIPSTKGIL